MKELELEWSSVVGVCTYGAAAMTGKKSDLSKRISDVASPDFGSTHCVLHRESLAAMGLSSDLKDTLTSAVKMINNIKMRPLQSRIFAKICEEADSEHKALLLHTEVRWLSRGRALHRLYELHAELSQHFEMYLKPILEKREKKSKKKEPVPLAEETFLKDLRDLNWLANLAYLVDIFTALNELNSQLQGRDSNCFKSYDKIDGFKRKLNLWKTNVANTNFDAFPMTKMFLAVHEDKVEYIQPIVLQHLSALVSKLDEYFPSKSDPREHHMWVVDPFLNYEERNTLSITEKNQLAGMFAQCRTTIECSVFCVIFRRPDVRSNNEKPPQHGSIE